MTTVWEYAVLRVDMAWLGGDRFEFTASAWMDGKEIYREVFSDSYWSKPLAEMGRRGWELVGTNAQNTLVANTLQGYPGNIALPVMMTFFFKRQAHQLAQGAATYHSTLTSPSPARHEP